MKHLVPYIVFENNNTTEEKYLRLIKKTFSIIEDDIRKVMENNNIEVRRISSRGFGDSVNEWFWFENLTDEQMIDYMVEEDTDLSQVRLSFKMIVETSSISKFYDVQDLINRNGKYELMEVIEINNPNSVSLSVNPNKKLFEFFVEYDMMRIVNLTHNAVKKMNESFTSRFRTNGYNITKSNDIKLRNILNVLLDKLYNKDRVLFEELISDVTGRIFIGGGFMYDIYKHFEEWYVSYDDVDFDNNEYNYITVDRSIDQISIGYICDIIDFLMKDTRVKELINRDFFISINESLSSSVNVNEKRLILRRYVKILKKQDPNFFDVDIYLRYFIIIHNFLLIEERFKNEVIQSNKEIDKYLDLENTTDVSKILDKAKELYDPNSKVRFAIETFDSIEEVRLYLKENREKVYSKILYRLP